MGHQEEVGVVESTVDVISGLQKYLTVKIENIIDHVTFREDFTENGKFCDKFIYGCSTGSFKQPI
jgi:hypothetical protein